jgi:two-component sensor histidine kinase
MHTSQYVSDALKTASVRLSHSAGLPRTAAISDGGDLALREAHHRMRNEMQAILSLMQGRRRSTRCGTERAACSACICQVTSVARLHELLQSEQPDPVDLSDFLRSICQLFSAATGLDRRISVHTEMESVWVRSNIADSIGLIVNEALTNAVKHAFPNGRGGCIRLSLKKEAPWHACLAIADNGVGSSVHASNGLGLYLMHGSQIWWAHLAASFRRRILPSMRVPVSQQASSKATR